MGGKEKGEKGGGEQIEGERGGGGGVKGERQADRQTTDRKITESQKPAD